MRDFLTPNAKLLANNDYINMMKEISGKYEQKVIYIMPLRILIFPLRYHCQNSRLSSLNICRSKASALNLITSHNLLEIFFNTSYQKSTLSQEVWFIDCLLVLRISFFSFRNILQWKQTGKVSGWKIHIF